MSASQHPDNSGPVPRRELYAVEHQVRIEDRWRRTGHKGGVLWLTGLSGAGKSTLALAAEKALHELGYQAYVLDGDNVRGGLNSDLGFSPKDRHENIRRIAEVAALFARSGTLVLTAFISPYQADRDFARRRTGAAFHEVFVSADLTTCETRDPKGLYRRARAGEIPEFTGVSAPYEVPSAPDLVVATDRQTVDYSVATVIDYVETNFTLNPTLVRVA
jgi:bifunctional enzyme CysN/CysC